MSHSPVREGLSCVAGLYQPFQPDSRQAMAVKAWLIEHEPGLAEKIINRGEPVVLSTDGLRRLLMLGFFAAEYSELHQGTT